MFNIPKVLELTIHNGTCLLTGKRIGPQTGYLADFERYEEFERASATQMDHFIEKMVRLCDIVDRIHAQILPSPFLSSVVDDCLARGTDVTASGARHNFSGIQAIQVANVADSLAVIKKLVFEDRTLPAQQLQKALQTNFEGREALRQRVIHHVPKYGNDVEWVDRLGLQWIRFFANRLQAYRNARGGTYHVGLYTVSAHVPMGKNVGAGADGRLAGKPLADGDVSPSYVRDQVPFYSRSPESTRNWAVTVLYSI